MCESMCEESDKRTKMLINNELWHRQLTLKITPNHN